MKKYSFDGASDDPVEIYLDGKCIDEIDNGNHNKEITIFSPKGSVVVTPVYDNKGIWSFYASLSEEGELIPDQWEISVFNSHKYSTMMEVTCDDEAKLLVSEK